MRRIGLLALLLAPAIGLARDPAPAHPEVKAFPTRSSEPVAVNEVPVPARQGWWTVHKVDGQPYDAAALRGAKALDLDPAYVQAVRDDLQLVFERDYDGARAAFHGLDNRFPGTGIGSAVDAVVWQAIMLENWDYRYEAQYFEANTKAQAQIEAALDKNPDSGWEHFLLAGMKGIQAIHTTRRGKYLAALQLALDAMSEAGKAREAAPEFTDLLLADGMYNYWRTVVTQSNRFLPDFGDNRKEGLGQMQTVEQQGIFLGPPATLSLAFSYIEEGQMGPALRQCRRNQRVYPDNIINLLVVGQVLTFTHRYDDALATWDHIQRVDPTNQRVLYWRGVTLLRASRSADAIASLQAYLGSGYLEPEHRAWAQYRLGEAYYRQKRYAVAEAAYEAAVKVNGHKPAKAALARMHRMRKDGAIRY